MLLNRSLINPTLFCDFHDEITDLCLNLKSRIKKISYLKRCGPKLTLKEHAIKHTALQHFVPVIASSHKSLCLGERKEKKETKGSKETKKLCLFVYSLGL